MHKPPFVINRLDPFVADIAFIGFQNRLNGGGLSFPCIVVTFSVQRIVFFVFPAYDGMPYSAPHSSQLYSLFKDYQYMGILLGEFLICQTLPIYQIMEMSLIRAKRQSAAIRRRLSLLHSEF